MNVEQPMCPVEGDEDLSDSSNRDPLPSDGNKARTRRKRKAKGEGRAKASDVGRALRSVYDTTLREDVPDDFLNLLGRLN